MGGLLSVAGSVPGSEELMYPIHVAAANGDSGWVRKQLVAIWDFMGNQ